MSKIILKLQDLKTGDVTNRECTAEEAAVAFLKARPRFVDVLGVVVEGLTPEQNARLKAAMRPLDDDERASDEALKKAKERASLAMRAEQQKAEEAAQARHREAMKTADPNRAMEVRYLHNAPLALVDHLDPREISEEARAAVLAWVEERNEWVADRGQIVAEAKVWVWPAKLPKPTADRVQGGTFIPVTGPAKPAT